MRRTITLLAIMSLGAGLLADDFARSHYVDADGQAVGLDCYWTRHFRRNQATERHLLIIIPDVVWDDLGNGKQTAARAWLARAAAGEQPLNHGQVTALKNQLKGTGAVVTLTDDPHATLARLAITEYAPPTNAIPAAAGRP